MVCVYIYIDVDVDRCSCRLEGLRASTMVFVEFLNDGTLVSLCECVVCTCTWLPFARLHGIPYNEACQGFRIQGFRVLFGGPWDLLTTFLIEIITCL